MSYQKNQSNIKKKKEKGLTKGLIHKFSILNGAKYFSSEIFQSYSAFKQIKKTH